MVFSVASEPVSTVTPDSMGVMAAASLAVLGKGPNWNLVRSDERWLSVLRVWVGWANSPLIPPCPPLKRGEVEQNSLRRRRVGGEVSGWLAIFTAGFFYLSKSPAYADHRKIFDIARSQYLSDWQ